MSISSEISRISSNVADALTAIGSKGVTVPQGSTSDDLATLIGSIQTGGGGTTHTIYFEFSDGTDVTLTGYWDSSFISDAIIATTPSTYGQKTVTLAQLDGVTWYEYDPSEPWETVYDNVTSMYVDGDARYFWLTSLSNVTIPLGSAWRITLDSTVYSLVGASHYVDGVGVTVVLGNPKWLGYEDDNTGVPFCFYNYNNNALCGDTELPAGNYSLKIERLVTA